MPSTDGWSACSVQDFTSYVDSQSTFCLPLRDTNTPTEAPTQAPTNAPTEDPTDAPTELPTEVPTDAPTEVPTTEGPEGDCVDSWIGDYYCDDQNNNAGCQWDGGDCCGNDSDSWDNFCSACECLDPDFEEEGPECDDIWTAKKCQSRKSKGKC